MPRRLVLAALGLALSGCDSLVSAPLQSDIDERPLPEPPRVEFPAPESGQEFRCDATAVDPGPTLSRRLTTREYVTAVSVAVDVDIESEARAQLPPDQSADGFSNAAFALIVSTDHVEAYSNLAQTIMQRVDLDRFLEQHATCRTLEAECVSEFLARASGPVLRGPLSGEEEQALTRVFDAVGAEDGTFDEGTAFALEAMLQSPRFVYRLEGQQGAGVVKPLDGYEVASRLSFLVWGAGPDAALLAAAADDRLSSAAEILEEVDRMLADPRAEAAAQVFFDDWLTLNRLPNVQRDASHFPEWSEVIAEAMQAETRNFVHGVIWGEARPMRDLFNAQKTFVSPELAAFYGWEPQAGSGAYDLASLPERGGILTQGSLLTVGGDEASMVARGLFVLNTFMCGSIDSPPDGVDITPVEPTADATQRDIALTRVESSACGGCHAQIEPPAFGLERFDSTGRYAEEDANGNALRSDGELLFPGTNEALPFESVADMMDLIAGHERTEACMVLKGTQFALGRTLTTSDGCGLAEIRDSFFASDGTYPDLIRSIATSALFRNVQIDSEVNP
ncbi:MAG: DUF1592 domain-containing protein [Myxococcota bacterium]